MNDSRRPDARRDLADELAARLAAGDDRAARLLQVLGVVAEPEAPAPLRRRPAEAAAGPRPISIWQPVTGARLGGAPGGDSAPERDLVFERPEPNPLGDHFAVRRRIRAAKTPGTRRVIWLGESAAAGYLYAPHLTPARLLQRQLDAASRRQDLAAWEVVDLARTNETLDGLAATAESATQLAPDAWAIFAGNNWELLETPEVSPWSPSVEARQRFALALRQAGLAGPVELARRRLRARIDAAFARIARAAADTPVVLVVPAVNLLDWAGRQPVPWLAGDGTARWHRHLEAAEAHLAAERWDEAEREAAEMLALEAGERAGGVTPTPHRLRAGAAIGRGDLPGALAAARAEVAAERYPLLAQLAAPRAGGEARAALREVAARHGFGCVDLEAVLAAPGSDGAIGTGLGSDSFLDYCHLDRRGMQRATAAVACALLGSAALRDDARGAAREAAAAGEIELAAAAEATALLGAAVHSAHRLAGPDKQEVLAGWCRQALATDPSAAEVMVGLAAVRAARTAYGCPEVWAAEQREMLRRAAPLQLQHGWRWDHLDADLLLAMHRALAAEGHGEAADRLLAIVVERCAVGAEPVDLAASEWLWEPLARFLPDALGRPELDGRALLRAPWPVTGFCLVTDGTAAVELEPLVRLPPIPGGPATRSGRVEVRVDGEPAGELVASQRWTRGVIRVAAERLPAGLHRLDLAWPPPPAAGDEARAGLLERLENGIEADLHPVFGEVFSLSARAGDG